MKDFIKWLGVNEKVAKVAVWMLIIMVFLIVTNTMLESVGFPHYAITYDNLVKINVNNIINTILSGIIAALNFYTLMLLIFRIKEWKGILKWIPIYLALNYIVNNTLGYIALQIFIVLFCIIFCYLYSNRNWKYIIYFITAYIFSIIVQGIWYTVKMQFIEYTELNHITKAILSFDYFIIIGLIILVKEIYLKKRGETKCGEISDASSGLENSTKKANSLKKSQKKQAA